MSWKADSQLVRTHDDGGINLAIGEPFFLQEVMRAYYPSIHIWDRLGYPKSEPEPELRAELERLHPGKYVVVTCGAKQALHAAIHALQMQSSGGFAAVRHPSPCWPTYGSIAELSALPFVNEGSHHGYININTSPNNPNGTISREPCDIWDAAYAHHTYGWRGEEPPHRISVWSAAKMLGCSGVRVGWLVTEDAALARYASAYVEMTTSGVPTNSQLFVAGTLCQVQRDQYTVFGRARLDLYDNSNELLRIQRHLDEVRGFPIHERGMFAWFKVRDDEKFQVALQTSKVRLLPGWACYEREQGWYRMSLGQHRQIMSSAMDVLNEALEKQ